MPFIDELTNMNQQSNAYPSILSNLLHSQSSSHSSSFTLTPSPSPHSQLSPISAQTSLQPSLSDAVGGQFGQPASSTIQHPPAYAYIQKTSDTIITLNNDDHSTLNHSQTTVLTSADYDSFVQNLMCHPKCFRIQSFAKKFIETLVNIFRWRMDQLNLLLTAIKSKGEKALKCVYFARPKDNLLRVGRDKVMPHVICCRMWRWPNVEKDKLKSVSHCLHGFHSNSDYICINPYHYEVTFLYNLFQNCIGTIGFNETDTTPNLISLIWNKYLPTPELPVLCQDWSALALFPKAHIWCSIAYIEYKQPVSIDLDCYKFKASNSCTPVFVNGNYIPSEMNEFCLGSLSNLNRTYECESTRMQIGQGIRLDLIDEGNVWLYSLTDQPVFVGSTYLDRMAGRKPGTTVHEIHPHTYVKVFDLNDCYSQMRQKLEAIQKVTAIHAPSTLGMSQTILDDDFIRMCLLQLSFVHGWGLDYSRRFITETPCWIQIEFYRAFQRYGKIRQSLFS